MLIILCVHVRGGVQVRSSAIELEAVFSEPKKSGSWILGLVPDFTKTESLGARCQIYTRRLFFSFCFLFLKHGQDCFLTLKLSGIE